MLRLLLAIPLLLGACEKDETISGFTDPQAVYTLQEIDGAHFPARATITFPEPGQVSGKGPCNSYGASQNAPYPWLELGPILATRASCGDLKHEIKFFKALSKMTLIEAFGDTVILRNDANAEMVFIRR